MKNPNWKCYENTGPWYHFYAPSHLCAVLVNHLISLSQNTLKEANEEVVPACKVPAEIDAYCERMYNLPIFDLFMRYIKTNRRDLITSLQSFQPGTEEDAAWYARMNPTKDITTWDDKASRIHVDYIDCIYPYVNAYQLSHNIDAPMYFGAPVDS